MAFLTLLNVINNKHNNVIMKISKTKMKIKCRVGDITMAGDGDKVKDCEILASLVQ
jgi:hypothetical protein